MRRLPVYLVIDTSASMRGEPLEAVKNGVQVTINTLRRDPSAIETAWLSVITFDSVARQVVPLTELATFEVPPLEATGSTSLGEALTLLAKAISEEVVKTTHQRKGDWRPLVFLMTDGQPTDDWEAGLARLRECHVSTLVACAAGSHAKVESLRRITESVVQLDSADSASISAFFRWVSASIATGSHRVETTQKEVRGLDELPAPPPEVNIVL